MGGDTAQEIALDVEILDDRLDDPIDLRQICESIEPGGLNAIGGAAREERIGFERLEAIEAQAGGVGGYVEQPDGQAGVGGVRGQLRAHRPGAEDGDTRNCHGRGLLSTDVRATGCRTAPCRNRSTSGPASASSEVCTISEDPGRRHLVERAHEDSRAEGRADVRAEVAAGLAQGDRVTNQADVLSLPGAGKRRHEFEGRPQLELAHHGEWPVALEPAQVPLGESAQAGGGIRHGGEQGMAFVDRLPVETIEDGDQQVVFPFEMQVDGAGGNRGESGDVGDLRGGKALVGERPSGRVEDGVAPDGGGHGGAAAFRRGHRNE